MSIKGKKTIVTSMVLGSGIAIGALVGSISGASFADDVTDYKTNSEGLTLGTVVQAEELGYSPDLVSATAENGVQGYVFSSELEGDMPKSPEEAATWNETHNVDEAINVYASDGKTVVGEFLITKSEVFYPSKGPR